jgi:basic membrane protein A and related proteins
MSALSRRAFLTMAAMASAGWAQPKQTSVVLLLTGVITDGGWNQLAFNGLKSLGPGFRTAYAENIGLAQMQEVARGYSDDGFDLIMGHGFEFSSAFARHCARLSKAKILCDQLSASAQNSFEPLVY